MALKMAIPSVKAGQPCENAGHKLKSQLKMLLESDINPVFANNDDAVGGIDYATDEEWTIVLKLAEHDIYFLILICQINLLKLTIDVKLTQ